MKLYTIIKIGILVGVASALVYNNCLKMVPFFCIVRSPKIHYALYLKKGCITHFAYVLYFQSPQYSKQQ